jgi:hypothetical protein
LVTLRGNTPEVNVAVTALSAFIVTVQGDVPTPSQPPPFHPVKTASVMGVAVNVTAVPEEKPALQVVPQSIPDGFEVTVPSPTTVTDRVRPDTNVAVTS